MKEVPAVVDLAAMRDAMGRLGGDPLKVLGSTSGRYGLLYETHDISFQARRCDA